MDPTHFVDANAEFLVILLVMAIGGIWRWLATSPTDQARKKAEDDAAYAAWLDTPRGSELAAMVLTPPVSAHRPSSSWEKGGRLRCPDHGHPVAPGLPPCPECTSRPAPRSFTDPAYTDPEGTGSPSGQEPQE